MHTFDIEDTLIGQTSDGSRVFVSGSWDGTRLSLTGTVTNHDILTNSGQITEKVRQVNPELADLWDRWHLNDLQPGCSHQEHAMRLDPSIRPTWINKYRGSTGLVLGSCCPECGYRYGTAWNCESVPESVLDRIYGILSA